MNNERVFSQFNVFYDKADTRNASLYLCQPVDVGGVDIESTIGELRRAGFWSDAAAAVVSETHKPLYIAQLQLLDWVGYASGMAYFLAVRFDHPKFRSDAERWRAWLTLLDGCHARHDLERL